MSIRVKQEVGVFVQLRFYGGNSRFSSFDQRLEQFNWHVASEQRFTDFANAG